MGQHKVSMLLKHDSAEWWRWFCVCVVEGKGRAKEEWEETGGIYCKMLLNCTLQ